MESAVGLEIKNKIEKDDPNSNIEQLNRNKTSQTNDQQNNDFIRKNSLIERNQTAKWFYNVFMKSMDKYAFARSMTIFTFQAFFLGNNLRIFLWMFIIATIYLILYRLIRFWTKRYLLYLMEFCYFGNAVLIYFLLAKNNSQEIFSITFICNSGLMTSAVLVFNNQTQFNSTDHLTSSWIHTLPLIVNWSIRWRHLIYPEETLKNLRFDFLDYKNINFEYDKLFYGLIYFPIIFWCCWAVCYLIVMGIFLRDYHKNPKYFSGLTDFKDFMKNINILGDPKNYTIFKYLFKHFCFLILTTPISIICFYNYYFNTGYVIFIIIYLAWNTNRNNIKHMNKKKGNLVEMEF